MYANSPEIHHPLVSRLDITAQTLCLIAPFYVQVTYTFNYNFYL